MGKKSKKKDLAVTAQKISEVPNWDGYYLYQIEILNKDGSTSIEPVLGKDMQHALSKINTKRKKIILTQTVEKIPVLLKVIAIIGTLVGILAVFSNPVWQTISVFTFVSFLAILGGIMNDNIQKQK